MDSGTSLIAAPASALMELGHIIGQIEEDRLGDVLVVWKNPDWWFIDDSGYILIKSWEYNGYLQETSGFSIDFPIQRWVNFL